MLDTNAIGKIVREERKALGLRQAELAAASGVGVRFLVDLERGKPTVQLGRVLAVLAVLGCSLDRKSVVERQSVSVRVDLGGRRICKKATIAYDNEVLRIMIT